MPISPGAERDNIADLHGTVPTGLKAPWCDAFLLHVADGISSDPEIAAELGGSVRTVLGLPLDEQAAVARIVRRAGESYRAIAATLDAEGHRPRRAASWSAMAVRSVAHRAMGDGVVIGA
jgi:hypothetical protein